MGSLTAGASWRSCGKPSESRGEGPEPLGGVGCRSESGSQQYCCLVTGSREQSLPFFLRPSVYRTESVRELPAPSRGLTVLLFVPVRWISSFSGVLTVPQGAQGGGWTEEEQAPRRAPRRCRSRRAWPRGVRCFPQPPGCPLLEFLLGLLQVLAPGATPFPPSRRPLGRQ